MLKLIQKASDLNFDLRAVDPMPSAHKILMVRPTYFNVDNPINAHMTQSDGSLHTIDKKLVTQQWETLRETYLSLGFPVKVVKGIDGLPDMCFCANQSLPFVDKAGKLQAILSLMHNSTRHQEVPYIDAALRDEGYETIPVGTRTTSFFEGMGDALWIPGRRFLIGGYGFRTTLPMYENILPLIDAHVAVIKLENPKFYHLDTCLSILDENTALACKEAFTTEGWALICKLFKTIIEVSPEDADSPGFACNAHCPDGKHVILQLGTPRVQEKLRAHGFQIKAVETGEFIKSGGSVFCLKLAYF